jgi:galactokinase
MRPERVATALRERTGRDPEGIWAAPGRVNLIGDHTDHSEGFVFPFAVDRYVVVAASRRGDDRVNAWSLQEAAPVGFDLGSIRRGEPGGWAAYVAGVVWSIGREGIDVGGLDILVDGAVPQGAGLSSSAALECATALAVADLHGAGLDPSALALAAWRAEVEIVGMPCGVMDQMASMCCRARSAMFLDTRSLEQIHVPLALDDRVLIVIDVGVRRRLVESEYARRRAECEAAARELGVAALRDATAGDLERLTDDTLRRRARHVVTENQRVLDAAELAGRADVDAIGPLLTASHASLRDDFAVSTPELDAAVEIALEAGALGARLTGAGFGGSAIALVPSGRLDELRARLSEAGSCGERRQVFVVAPAGGASRVG